MSRRPVCTTLLLGAVLGMMAADGATGGAQAQGRLDAQYVVTLGGIPFGRGSWQIDVREDQFTASVNGATAGIMRMFTTGKASSAARGVVSRGQLFVSSYASTISTDRRYDEVHMALSNGVVKEFVAEPPTIASPERVPLTEAHRRGVTDPMTASLMPVPGNGDTFVPEACPRKLAIFDGRMRYDLQLAFKRLDRVKSEKGYQGTVVVCALQFSPIAGHVPERAVIKYLIDLRDIEVWLAPIAGTRLMVPYRVTLPTPVGLGIMQASQFVSVPQSARAAASGSKSQ
jgi:Protein of unknown function (DUF3108)